MGALIAIPSGKPSGTVALEPLVTIRSLRKKLGNGSS